MDYQVIRFHSKPFTLQKKYESYHPNRKYWNELSSLCTTYLKLKEFNETQNLVSREKIDNIITDSINDPKIIFNCGLSNFPFQIGSGKFIETELLKPCGEKLGRRITPQYYLVSKKYILLEYRSENNSEYLKIADFKRLEDLQNNKRVKLYDIEIHDSKVKMIKEE